MCVSMLYLMFVQFLSILQIIDLIALFIIHVSCSTESNGKLKIQYEEIMRINRRGIKLNC